MNKGIGSELLAVDFETQPGRREILAYPSGHQLRKAFTGTAFLVPSKPIKTFFDERKLRKDWEAFIQKIDTTPGKRREIIDITEDEEEEELAEQTSSCVHCQRTIFKGGSHRCVN